MNTYRIYFEETDHSYNIKLIDAFTMQEAVKYVEKLAECFEVYMVEKLGVQLFE